jgi:hypothetical protein
LHLALSACKTTDDRIKTLLEFLKSLLETKLPEIKWLETAIKNILFRRKYDLKKCAKQKN